MSILVVLSSCRYHGRQENRCATTDCVYVCTGPHAKRYHTVEDCVGLSNCSSDIITLSVSAASANGYTPCHRCCKD
jgi:hypothetical protein